MTGQEVVPTDIWASGARRALKWQAVLGLLAAVLVGVWQGPGLGLGVAYGVVLALANGAWLAHRIDRASSLDQAAGQRVLYAGAVARFLVLLAALALAHFLSLHLLAVAAGLLLVQLAAFFMLASGQAAGESGKESGSID